MGSLNINRRIRVGCYLSSLLRLGLCQLLFDRNLNGPNRLLTWPDNIVFEENPDHTTLDFNQVYHFRLLSNGS